MTSVYVGDYGGVSPGLHDVASGADLQVNGMFWDCTANPSDSRIPVDRGVGVWDASSNTQGT